MKIHPVLTMLSILLTAGLMLQGCAQSPLKTEPIPKTENPAQLIGALGQDLEQAKAEQVNMLSPTWYADARESYRSAQKRLNRGDVLADIWEDLSNGRAQLDQAREFAEQSRYHLGDVVDSRKMAIKAGAPRYKKEFSGLEDDFIDLTKAVEKKNIKLVLSRKVGLNQGYRDLELRAIKDAALMEVRRNLKSLEDQKVQKIAPKSHAQAVGKINEADAFITQNRYDSEVIASHAALAGFYVKRLGEMAKASNQIETMAPEDIALEMESRLHQTASHLEIPDQRNTDFDSQQSNIIDVVSAMQREQLALSDDLKAKTSQVDRLKLQIAELEGRSYQVKADKERLAAEKRFNELFNKVQGYFSENEAEVYKQADRLVIRLKAVQFPVGQAIITPDNYGLLAKVQKSITTFGQPRITIEGHTDSTGSLEKNKLLSQQRADAVRAYLIANNTLPGNLITAVGYGPSRPLAPNETAEGRAINRRIDVVIKPTKK
jgi:outer membrane protein OmpA-like peptidoglycan-associated protein